jgi:hypothetical protein
MSNPALQSYLGGVENRHPSPLVGPAAEGDIFEAFDQSMLFLGDADRFPDPRLNIFLQSAKRLIDGGLVRARVPFLTDQLPRTAFTTAEAFGIMTGHVYLPDNLHHLTQEDPVFQLTGVVNAAYHSRLFVTGAHAHPKNHEILYAHTSALAADMLATVGRMATEEGIEYDFSQSYDDPHLLDQLDGFESLPAATTFRNREVLAMPESLLSRQVDLLARFDYRTLTTESGPSLLYSMYELIGEGEFDGPPAIERILRALNSPVLLYAIQPSEGGPEIIDPRTRDEKEFRLLLTRVQSPADIERLFERENISSYEENYDRLADAGIPA